MRKSNFLKKSFSSEGKFSPHFQGKKIVTLNIILGLLIGIVGNCKVANAQVVTGSTELKLIEVTSSVPDDILAELKDVNYHLNDVEIALQQDYLELNKVRDNTEILVNISGYIFGAIFLIIVCIVFIAVYKLFSIFFRF